MRCNGKQSLRTRILASCATVLLVFGVGTFVAQAGNPVMFAPIDGSIAVAASPERILVMTYLENPRVIYQVDGSGTVTPFATLPVRDILYQEDDIHFAPALGGWPAGYAYATQGEHVYKISPSGTSVTLFATLPIHVGGIVFDKVGSFGFDMLLTGGDKIWRVTPTGTATMVGGFGPGIEGPDVAPLSFGPYGGWVFVGCNNGYIMAMSPTGESAMVFTFDSAERVHFVPADLGTLEGTGLSFFAATYPGGVVGYPMTDFEGMAGKGIVTSEYGGGIGQFEWNGSAYVVSPFCAATWQHEMSDFVETSLPRPVPLDVKPTSCPNPINVGKGGVLPMAILGFEGFDVRQIDPTTVRLAGVAPIRWASEDVAAPFVPFLGKLNCTSDCWTEGPDGILDMTFKFDNSAVVAALGPVYDRQCMVITVTGNTFDGRPFVGEDVILILKKK